MSEIDDQMMRKLLFTPCKNKQDLHRFIKIFLGLDMPDCTVDPESNSNPMDLIHYVYSKAQKNDDENFAGVLFYAARDCFKTLTASIIETLFALHFNISCCIGAAIEEQAKISAGYIKNYLNRPILREFITAENERKVEITHYKHTESGMVLNTQEYTKLPPSEQLFFEKNSCYVQVVVATIKSMNGFHVPLLCVDGKTKLLTKSNYKNRLRKKRTAAGIFNELNGDSPLMRKEDLIFDKFIETPVKIIEVLSLNNQTGKLEFKPIVNASRTKQTTLRVKLQNGKSITCSSGHPLYALGKGFIPANELSVGLSLAVLDKGQTDTDRNLNKDSYTSVYQESETDPWEQVILGSLLGDGGVYKKITNNPYFKEQHCVEQAEYLNWKRSIVGNKLKTSSIKCYSGYTGKEQVGFATGCSPALLPYVNVRKDLSKLNRLEALGLAVWYMDDGCAGNSFRISSESFDETQNEILSQFINYKFGFNTKVSYYSKNDKTYYYILGTVEDKRRLNDICSKYIHPSLAYKFDLTTNKGNCKYCNNEFFYYESSLTTCNNTICQLLGKGLTHSPIESIEQLGENWTYDFTVADNYNYFGDGFLNKNCFDEVDIAPEKPIQEGKMMATPGPKGQLPILMFTSTRKYAFGPVQKEIERSEPTTDNPHGSGIKVFKWNLIDMTQACPPSRHLPEQPKIPIYINREKMSAIDQERFDALPMEEQTKYVKSEGFAGCLKNCKLFSVCRGHLANQKSTSTLLKPIPHTINMFRQIPPELAKAQLMCWRPGNEGLVYPNFSKDRHQISAAAMANKMTGEEYPENMSKAQLIDLIKKQGLQFYSGMDFGYTHFFAVVTAALLGNKLFIIDVIAQAGLEDMEKVEMCKRRIEHLKPIVFPDPASPQTIKLFRKYGFICKDFKKDVLGGIEIVRSKIHPGLANPEPELFLLKYDDGCDELAKRIQQYHWMLDASGRPTDVPNEDEDDTLDALRYMCQNLFGARGKVRTGDTVTYTDADGKPNWMAEEINRRRDPNEVSTENIKGGKGNFKFTF